SDEDGALDKVHGAIAALGLGSATEELANKLRGIVAELDDAVAELRAESESVEEDPERLEEIRRRRHLLRDLRRKYGERLEDVLAYFSEASTRLNEMLSHDARVAKLEADRSVALEELAKEELKVLAVRKKVAPKLATAVNALLPGLALANARVEIEVQGNAGDEVEIRFSANPGMPMQPLSKVASGGETSRLMLAMNLVLTTSPPTLVFDEVDAGIGGDAANTVAEALGKLGLSRQVLVVTHLPQVAASASQQVFVSKRVEGKMTFAEANALSGSERIAEIARMLSGDAQSKTALAHAKEIINAARTRIEGRVS
ncbi:MAG: DNA repair protein RecN, partial [Actinobacteria bacterium]|nr:DNA repair protein RecN [Actinomycetota bacterium]